MLKRYSLTESIKLLLVEDSSDDAALFEHHLLVGSQRPIELVRATSLAEGISKLGKDIDLVFLDLGLSDSFGIHTFQRIRQKAPFMPIIILTNSPNNELAMEVLRSGAEDLLVKSELTHSLIERSMMYAFERRYAAEAHERLASIVTFSRDSIVGATLDGIVESWNRGAEEIYGYSASEMVGKSLSVIVPPEKLFEQYLYFEKIKAGETVPTFETRRRTRRGDERIISLNATAIRNADGKVTGISLVGRDITVQISTQRNIEQANENLKLAATAARMGIWTYTARKFNFDGSCLEMFGVDPATFDQSFRSFMHCVSEKDRERVFNHAQGNLESDEEFQVVWPDGTAHDILAKGREYIDGNGVRTWAGICMDVTERRQQQRQAALVELLQQREEFTATLTHDLKNPLIAVNRLLEFLISGRMGAMTEEQTKLMIQLKETNSGLLDLIRNLLDIYREEQQVLGHTREITDIREIVEECVNQFEPIAQMRSVQIHRHLPDEPLSMMADRHGIRRIMQNLLDNAIKFSEMDGEINVKLVRFAHEVIFEIEDSGKGVPPAEQKRLFERFAQGSEGRKYTDGSGLGLYLCRRLAEAHGGTIDYVGKLDEGAKFRVALPLALRRTLSGEFHSLRK